MIDWFFVIIVILCLGLPLIIIPLFILREFVILQIGLYAPPLEEEMKKK